MQGPALNRLLNVQFPHFSLTNRGRGRAILWWRMTSYWMYLCKAPKPSPPPFHPHQVLFMNYFFVFAAFLGIAACVIKHTDTWMRKGLEMLGMNSFFRCRPSVHDVFLHYFFFVFGFMWCEPMYLKHIDVDWVILLFQVPIAGQSVHYVSYKRNPFYPMKLPKYTLPKVASHIRL